MVCFKNFVRLGILSIFISLVFSTSSNAQITVNAVNPTTNSLDTIIRRLVGPGVTISNITSNIGQNTQAYGSFIDNAATPVTGIQRGLIMTTGNVSLAPGPNGQLGETGAPNPGGASDPQLAALVAPLVLNDVCAIQFNFVPFGDTIKFSYVFGSEEYPNFSCSPFNDVFGFFVNGPNPAGGTYNNVNIARIPGTTLPVAITNVTNGGCSPGTCPPANASFFVSNFITGSCTQGTLNIGYDGFTVRLDAVIAVVPCQPYTLKLAIADVSDSSLDSFVMIEEGSFTSIGAKVETASLFSRFDYMVRGCNPFDLNFIRQDCILDTIIVRLAASGAAVNGVDYSLDSINNVAIPDSIIIPVGVDTVSLRVYGLIDPAADPIKEAILTLLDEFGQPTNRTINFEVRQEFEYETASDVDICAGDSVQINPVPFNTSDSVLWTPSTGLSCNTCLSPFALPLTTTSYKLTVIDSVSGCKGSDTVTVFVYEPITAPAAGCPGVPIVLTATGASVPLQYLWTADPTISSSLTQQTISVIPATSRFYKVRVTYPLGCVLNDSIFLEVTQAPVVRNIDTSLCFQDSLLLDFNNTFSDTIVWNQPNNQFVFNQGTLTPYIKMDTSGIFNFSGFAKNSGCETPFNIVVRKQEELLFDYEINLVDAQDVIIRPLDSLDIQSLPIPFRLEFALLFTNSSRVRHYWFLEDASGNRLIDSTDLDRIYLDVLEGGTYRLFLTKYLTKGNRAGDTCMEQRVQILNVKPFIPANVITPNGDGQNDVFFLSALSAKSTFNVVIYNRWGREIYSSDNYRDDWAANDVEGGVYYYNARQEPEGKSYNGWIQVVK